MAAGGEPAADQRSHLDGIDRAVSAGKLVIGDQDQIDAV